MLISYVRSQTSVIVRVKIRNSSVSTGAGLTGLTSGSSGLIISTIADNEATAVTYTVAGSTIETISTLGTYAAPTATKCRFKLVDDTNHPGIYEIHLADARFAVASAKSLLISILGATNAAQCDAVIPLTDFNPYSSTDAGLSKLSSLTFTVANQVDANTKSISDDGPAADALEAAFDGQITGTADSGSTTTMVDSARTEADADYWKGAWILFTSGTISGQCRLITGFNEGTDTITFAPATTQAVSTNTYEIIPSGRVDVGMVGSNTTVPTNQIVVYATDFATNYDATNDKWAVLAKDHAGANLATAAALAALNNITAAEVWAVGTRTLTTLDEDSTTLDLDTTIRAALGMASANLDTQLDAIPTNAELATALTNLDAAVSTRATPAQILTTQLTEAYATDGAAPTLTQALMLIQQALTDVTISGTTVTIRRLDGSTVAATLTLNDGTTPTAKTRAT